MRPRISIEEHRRWLREALKGVKLRVEGLERKLKEHMAGESFEFFASWRNYPVVSIGITTAERAFSLPSLYGKSYNHILSTFLTTTTTANPRHVSNPSELLQPLAMSTKPVDVELFFSRKPSFKLNLSPHTYPLGPRAPLKKLREQENPHIPRKVYSLWEEKVKATTALEELYARGYDSYYLTKLLSAGVLGENKKIVPTRWAITAVDDSLANFNISIIRDYKPIENIEVYESYFLHNRFVVLLLPGVFAFENFEAWAPKTTWGAEREYMITEEYESLRGRKTYAKSQAGAYYAVKYIISEFLRKRRRQARVIVIREVYEGYNLPVGVWQVRENVRHALSHPPKVFSELKEALSYMDSLTRLPISLFIKKSRIIGQPTLHSFSPL